MTIKIFGAKAEYVPLRQFIRVWNPTSTKKIVISRFKCESTYDLFAETNDKLETCMAAGKGEDYFISTGWGDVKEFYSAHRLYKKLHEEGIL